MEPLRHAHLESPLGTLWLAATPAGLAALEIGGSEEEARSRWRRTLGRESMPDPLALRLAAQELEAYFAGALTRFHCALDLQGTAFQRKVWSELRAIPYGETRSYKRLAAQVGQPTASRAVAAANARNPLPIVVPCHRVVQSDGQLGGYTSGIDHKRWLLRHEGALPGG